MKCPLCYLSAMIIVIQSLELVFNSGREALNVLDIPHWQPELLGGSKA